MYTSELVVGHTYKIRLKLIANAPNAHRFNICITTPTDICDMEAYNYDFEQPSVVGFYLLSSYLNELVVPGWRRTSSGDPIFYHGDFSVNAFSGAQSVQLTANGSYPNDSNYHPWIAGDDSTHHNGMYRDFDTSEIKQIDYNFATAARSPNPIAVQLYAGPPTGPFTLVNEKHTNGTLWELNTGSYVVPVGQTKTRFIFVNKEYLTGAMLDAASFKPNNKIISKDEVFGCGSVLSKSVEAQGVGHWEADSNNPKATTIVENPTDARKATITGFNKPGEYIYHWKTRYCDELLKITYNGFPEEPAVTTPVVYCKGATASALQATAPSGFILKWYTVPTGGTASTTAPTPSTATEGTTTYYVSLDNGQGCEGGRTPITVEVKALPTAGISGTAAICSGATATITFTGTANATVSYTADNSPATVVLDGDGHATVITPSLTGASTYSLVSVTSSGTPVCSQNATGTALITIAEPTASIGTSTTVCSGASATVTFTGTAGATVNYTVNGTPASVLLNGQGIATVTTPALTANTTYELVSITTSGTPTCTRTLTGTAVFTIALPTAGISGNTTICSGASATITFTGSSNATVTYKVNGGSNQTVLLDGTGTKAVTTGTLTSNAVYSLVSVTSSGTPSCSQLVTGTATVAVQGLPTAEISGTAAICSGATTAIIFTGTANATVSYTVDNSPATVVLDGDGYATVTTPALTGASTYSLVSVTSSGTLACSQNVAGTAVITIAKPFASIDVAKTTTSVCSGATATVAFTGTPGATVAYTVNGGSTQNVLLNGQGVATVTTPILTSNATYAIESVTASGIPSCTEIITGQIAVITVQELPTASIAVLGAATVCEGTAATVKITGTAGATVRYKLNNGSPTSVVLDAAGEKVLTISALTSNATYELVDVTAAGVLACSQSVTGTASVMVKALPTANILGTTAVCSGATANITFTGTAGATVNYTVNGSTSQVVLGASGATVSTGALTANATYSLVSVTSADAPVCSKTVTGTAVVTVNPLPMVNVANVSTCSGVNTTVTATPGVAGTYTYAWTVPSGVTPIPTGATFQTTVAGDYSVIITNTATGCVSASATGTVTVNPLPSVEGASTVCSGSTIALTGSATPATTGAWVSSNVAVATISTSGVVTGVSAGPVTITYKNTDGCTVTHPITVGAVPVVEIVSTCNTDREQLLALKTGEEAVWSVGQATLPANTVFNVDDYFGENYELPKTVTATLTGTNGCTASSNFEIITKPCVMIPKGFSPDGDKVNDSFDLTGREVNEITIFNRYGTKVYSYTGDYDHNQWTGTTDDGKELPDGTYFYNFTTVDGHTETGWVFINRVH
jgi:gliding motility-associated-like protein